MTDKQIIIDGVDVKDCKRRIGKDNFCRYYKRPCTENNYNCIWKKYLRKEQECERLKKAKKATEEASELFVKNADEIARLLENKLDQLKAENDNLKSLIWWIHVGAEGADKATTEYYENRNTPYEENYWKRIRALQPPTYESKYKLALTEIKEIVFPKNQLIITDSPIILKIQEKISEVEDD